MDTAALKMPDKIKGPLFPEAASTLRVPAWPCCREFAGRGVGASGVFPSATPDAAKNENNSNNGNETNGPRERGRAGRAY